MVVSRNITRGQSWTIVGVLSGQVAFVAMRGVQSTSDTLILNIVPLIAYTITQFTLLLYIIKTWIPSKQ
jgi:hypothetical protein